MKVFLNKATSHKFRNHIIVSLFILLLFLAKIFFFSSTRPKSRHQTKPIEIQVAADSIDTEKMWRNHLEEKIIGSEESQQEHIAKIKDLISKELEKLRMERRQEIDGARREIDDTRKQYSSLLQDIKDLQTINADKNQPYNMGKEVSISSITPGNELRPDPEDGRFYIPETSYLTGYLMGGIAVSTSIGSASEPVPIAVRIIDKGNFPSNFDLDVRNCRILGSAYGDLSSERAVIRAETLICSRPKKNEIITTKISGIIYGDDGMNGIRGRIIDMSSKHIKNAALGGMISGFASTIKSETGLALNPLQTADRKIEKKLMDNSMKGASSAAEKIADYYIKQAENMSPILMIPGGTKVDVVFTRGVLLGSNDIRSKILKERR